MLVETTTIPASPAAAPSGAPRGQLAQSLQEAFTVAVRLRARRSVSTDADAFREQVKLLLANADRDARRQGYNGDDVRLAVYAYVAFLDESVLNSGLPVFAGWTRRPLQEEIFGDNVAGENFFRNLSALLSRPDSEALADLIEVYLLCLLLGFRGRFAASPESLDTVRSNVAERLQRIRGAAPMMGPDWDLPASETVPVQRDPWLRRLALGAAGALALAILLFIGFRLSLGSALANLQATASSMIR